MALIMSSVGHADAATRRADHPHVSRSMATWRHAPGSWHRWRSSSCSWRESETWRWVLGRRAWGQRRPWCGGAASCCRDGMRHAMACHAIMVHVQSALVLLLVCSSLPMLAAALHLTRSAARP